MPASPDDQDTRPEWDEQRAQELIGATVLIGITRVRSGEAEQEQMFGVIRAAHRTHGFSVDLGGTRSGEIYRLPPDCRNFMPAPPGDYRLRSTGELVFDPDVTATWTLHLPE